jgi:quercetin dioxygenase-like cupin family protein
MVDGVEHSLGSMKDFRQHPQIAAFLPESARLALSWVHLDAGESLDTHIHEIDSLIIVANGHGRVVGDLEDSFSEGDIVLIPQGHRHGFEGTGSDGFWAISTQFEQRGIYENPDNPLVKFEGTNSLANLLLRNDSLREEHHTNRIFDFVSGEQIRDPARRQRFMHCVQVWSGYYQKTLMARTAFTEDLKYAAIFRRHLNEEYGHDTALNLDLGSAARIVWDPLLDATASWFLVKMLTLDNLEKLVLIHLVLETAGSTFHKVAATAMARFGETNYFSQHSEVDDQHASVAIEMLEGHDSSTYAHLMEIQRQGWDMLNKLCERMVEIANDDRKNSLPGLGDGSLPIKKT